MITKQSVFHAVMYVEMYIEFNCSRRYMFNLEFIQELTDRFYIPACKCPLSAASGWDDDRDLGSLSEG